jgi:ParB-like nuclease domain
MAKPNLVPIEARPHTHPAAECVRLMDDDEINALVDSIKADGLLDPIVIGRIDGAEYLVDGRNRLHACEIAGIKPRFEVVDFKDDDEVRAFVRARSERRDLTKGQRAMRMALLYPEPSKGGRGKKSATNSKETLGFTPMRLSQARAVLAFSHEIALQVRDGVLSLDKALADIDTARDAAASHDAKLARLRDEAPDLAEQVSEERLTLTEAWAAFEQRKAEAAKVETAKRETIVRVVSGAYSNILAIGVPDFLDGVYERVGDEAFRAELLKYMRIDTLQFYSISDGAAALTKLVEVLQKGESK